MAALSESDIVACTHPRQFPRFLLAFMFCLALAPILAAVAVFFTAILLLPLLVLAIWLVRETAYAHAPYCADGRPSARRIASSGAGKPVQSVKAAAP